MRHLQVVQATKIILKSGPLAASVPEAYARGRLSNQMTKQITVAIRHIMAERGCSFPLRSNPFQMKVRNDATKPANMSDIEKIIEGSIIMERGSQMIFLTLSLS